MSELRVEACAPVPQRSMTAWNSPAKNVSSFAHANGVSSSDVLGRRRRGRRRPILEFDAFGRFGGGDRGWVVAG